MPLSASAADPGTVVTTADDLKAAVEKDGKMTLGDDITITVTGIGSTCTVCGYTSGPLPAYEDPEEGEGYTVDYGLEAITVESDYEVSTADDGSGHMVPVVGAAVKLVQGNAPLDETVILGPDGEYSFTNAAPGDYNVVAEKTEAGGAKKTMTVRMTVVDEGRLSVDPTMPSGNVSSVLKVNGDSTPDVVVRRPG